MSPRLHPVREKPLARCGSRTNSIHCTVSSSVLSKSVACLLRATCTFMTKQAVYGRFGLHGRTTPMAMLLWKSLRVARHCMAVLYSNWLNWLSILSEKMAMKRKANYAVVGKAITPNIGRRKALRSRLIDKDWLSIEDHEGDLCEKRLA